MATTIIRPTSDNAILRAKTNADATTNLYACVDEETASDVDYVKEVLTEETSGYAVFNFENVSLPTGSVIDKIVLFARVKASSNNAWTDIHGATYGFKINTHSTNYSYEPTGLTYGSFTNATKELTVNPHTGSAWTETEINDLIYGFSSFTANSKGATLEFSQLYVTVYYTEGIVNTTNFFMFI